MQPPACAPADESRRQIAALLRDRREELIATWTERVLADPGVPEANRLAAPDLRDHMPLLLDSLARDIDSPGSNEATGRAIGASRSAREHAQHRAAKGYEITEALRELSHFRATILDLCSARGVPMENGATKLLHAAIDETMITGGDEMEKAALAALERQAALRERFIGILGHDLRNPLQAILFVAASLLKRDDTTEAQAKLVRRIVVSADRMGRMIADLLDLTRARMGSGIPVDAQPANLADVVRQAVEEVCAAQPGKPVTVDADGPVRGSWDADRMAQVVCNLVSNALDYSPEGAPVAVCVRGDRGGAILAVHNDGPPIAPEVRSCLFDPFVQGQRAVPGEGLGLGLFIAHQIVLAHGGSIDVTTGAGEGTTFTVRLPRRG
jgi:signal transduction histidine kinase